MSFICPETGRQYKSRASWRATRWNQAHPEQWRLTQERHYTRRFGTKATYQRQRRHQRRELLETIKAAQGCQMCGEKNPVCLEFHHRDPSQKRFHIGRQAACCPMVCLLAEIKKCDVLCCNCHRILERGKREV